MKDDLFEFCTRCGYRVRSYPCNDSLTGFNYADQPHSDDFSSDGGYIGDLPSRFVPASYWCEQCGRRWWAFASGDTSSQWPCSHWMPVYVEFCAICGMMNSAAPVLLSLVLIQSSGWFYQVGFPTLLCWLHSAHLPASTIDDGKIVVIHYDQIRRGWNEHAREVTMEQSQRILERLKRLGFPTRLPAVDGKEDTGNQWSHLSLQVGINNQSSLLSVSMQSSGFEGRDADLLRGLFQDLFRLAGFVEFDPVVYGNRRMN